MKLLFAAGLVLMGVSPAWAQDAPPSARTLEERVAQLEASQAALSAQVKTLQQRIEELLSVLRAAIAAPRNAGIPVPPTPIALDGAPSRGAANAPVVIVEYSDFQCPYCAAFSRDTLPALMKDYVDTGKVLFVFRHMPLDSIHPRAARAAAAADCAFQQNRFWEMHNALFADQAHLDDASLTARARNVGLRMDAYASCMAAANNPRADADAKNGAALGITGTPTFLVGTPDPAGGVRVAGILEGTRPIADFKAVVDKLSAAPAAR